MNDNTVNPIPAFMWRLLFAAALVAVFAATQARAAEYPCDAPIATIAPASSPVVSWMFNRGRYTHDPETGARVAQYDRPAPVEPLPDPRLVTSGYSRTRTVMRGADGSTNSYYQVQNYGNGRGGMDAEWERFHDAWRGSTVAGGFAQGFVPPYGFFPGTGWGGGFPGYGWGHPGNWHGGGRGQGFDYRGPDPRWLDPDAADGYPDGRRRTPDRHFFGPNQRFFPQIQPDEADGS